MPEQIATLPPTHSRSVLVQFLELTKPRVNSLIVFTAVIGMMLGYPAGIPWDIPLMLTATVGIALVAGAAAAFNCLVEQAIDRKMARTRARPTVAGNITTTQILLLAGAVGGVGLLVLYRQVNALTMWLTLATFVGYAIIYTVILKPATPQNIVIGGASGAMPPVLGWAAVTGAVDPNALLLFLIIFAWTPPHFWALALFGCRDYAKAGVPMLPVVAGKPETRRQIVIYSVLMAPLGVVPYALGLVGPIYAAAATVLGLVFVAGAFAVWRDGKADGADAPDFAEPAARRLFGYSIVYLFLLFGLMIFDRVPYANGSF